MKYFIALMGIFLFGISSSLASGLDCKKTDAHVPDTFKDMCEPCVEAVRRQIKKEISASSNYLAAGSHFLKSTVNRPGFAKFFINAAKEEREHSMKLMEYLLVRGVTEVHSLIEVPKPEDSFVNPTTGAEALREALKLEAIVTKSIRDVIEKCEKCPSKLVDGKTIDDNDYHLVDYLTGEFLEEQYKGQRDLAGMISTLGKMESRNGAIGEFLYDKKLLD